MRSVILNFKHAKVNAIFYRKIIPTDIDKKPYFDNGVPFKIGIVRSENKHEFNVPNLRSIDTSHTIFTFRDLEIRTGDKVSFDNKEFFVEDVSFSYYESTRNKVVKQYFMTIK